ETQKVVSPAGTCCLLTLTTGSAPRIPLRSNEHRLRLIIDSIPGHILTLSAAGEVELVNRQALEYFGKTTEEIKNWAASDAVHPDDLSRLINAWRNSVEPGQPFEDELGERGADGVYRWVHLRARPQRDA